VSQTLADLSGGRHAIIAEIRRKSPAERRTWPIPGADESFRSLYTSFDITSGTTLAVCSSVSGEGKTTVSLGLALAIAQDLPDRRVVLVETDLWRSVLAKDFGLQPDPGLVECLLDRQPVSAALRSTALDNLSFLVAGTETASAQRLLRSARMPQIVEELRRTHDVVILDTPALLAHSETALIARMAEEAIFIVRTGVTPANELTAALGRLQGRVKGIVVNDARSAVPSVVRRLLRR